jgi:hypothetical protein
MREFPQMLFDRAYRPEKIRVGMYALLWSLYAQPDVAFFDFRFGLVPQPIVEVAIDFVGSPLSSSGGSRRNSSAHLSSFFILRMRPSDKGSARVSIS